MKKDKDIKILKKANSLTDDENYTFIVDNDINPLKSNDMPSMNTKSGYDVEPHVEIANTKEEKYKKKKVTSKVESKSKYNNALKFSNPSQRNHSSVYEWRVISYEFYTQCPFFIAIIIGL